MDILVFRPHWFDALMDRTTVHGSTSQQDMGASVERWSFVTGRWSEHENHRKKEVIYAETIKQTRQKE